MSHPKDGAPDSLSPDLTHQPQAGMPVFDQKTWDDIVFDLEVFAHFRVRLAMQAHGRELSVSGMKPADFAHQALEKYLCGDRTWNPEKCPDFVFFLKGIVRSDLSEAFRKASKIDPHLNTSEPGGWGREILQDDATESEMDLEIFQQHMDEILDGRSDELLRVCWKAILKGGIPPRELGKELGLAAEVIYKARRRLKAILQKANASLRFIEYC